MPTQMNLPTLVAEAVLAELARNPELYRSVTPGPKGEDLTLGSIVMEADYSMTLTFSDGTTYNTPPVRGERGPKGVEGDQGPRGVGIHHTRWTATTNPEHHFGVAGHMDTYTLYGDEDELVVLGWFSVKNGENGKDPYDYAVADGYEGTREEFYKDFVANATNIQQIENILNQTIHLTEENVKLMDTAGEPGGIMLLDAEGLVPVAHRPEQEKELVFVSRKINLPLDGELGTLYTVLRDETADNVTTLYVWSGTEYLPIQDSVLAETLATMGDSLQALTEAVEELEEGGMSSALVNTPNYSSLPSAGQSGVLYIVAEDENQDYQTTIYVWSGNTYKAVSGGSGSGSSNEHLRKDAALSDLIDKEAARNNLELREGALARVQQGTGTSTSNVMSQNAVSTALSGKVNAVAGYGLSETDFTAVEKDKLAGLEGSHYKGFYADLAALQAAVPFPEPGDYADIDALVGQNTVRYIYNVSLGSWEAQVGKSTQLVGSQIKSMYESQPDTNAFTNWYKTKVETLVAQTTDFKVVLGTGLEEEGEAIAVRYGFTAGTALEGDTLVEGTGQNTRKVISQKGVTDALGLKANKAVTVTAGDGLLGGGDLSQNRVFNIDFGTAPNQAAAGDHKHLAEDITDFTEASELRFNALHPAAFTAEFDSAFGTAFIAEFTASFPSAFTAAFAAEHPAIFDSAFTGAFPDAFTAEFTPAFDNAFGSAFISAYNVAITESLEVLNGYAKEAPDNLSYYVRQGKEWTSVKPTIAFAETAIEYVDGLVTKVIEDGKETLIEYNNEELVSSITYPNGRVETFLYDADNTLIEIIAVGG